MNNLKDYLVVVGYADGSQVTRLRVCSPSKELLEANVKEKLPEARRDLVNRLEIDAIEACAHQNIK